MSFKQAGTQKEAQKNVQANVVADLGRQMHFGSQIIYPAPQVYVSDPAPDFETEAVINQKIVKVRLSDYTNQGKWVILMWYPKDFSYVCPTEILATNDRRKEFESLGAAPMFISVDSPEVHTNWIKTPRNKGGLGTQLDIPLLSDQTKVISAIYGTLQYSSGVSLRGTAIVDPDGIVQHFSVNAETVGRNVDETLRILQALQFAREHGEVCPSGWKPGDKGMTADQDKAQEYFKSKYEEDGHGIAPSSEDPGAEIASRALPLRSQREIDEFIAQGNTAVIDWFANWCPHCQQMGPLVDELASKNPSVKFAKVDLAAGEPEQQNLRDKYKIPMFPTYRFYHKGKEVIPEVVGHKDEALSKAVHQLAQRE